MSSELLLRATSKGLGELANRTDALSMMERRMLILANGKRTTTQISTIMKRADLLTMTQRLVAAGFLETVRVRNSGTTESAAKSRRQDGPEQDDNELDSNTDDGDAKDQMLAALDLLTTASVSDSVRQKIKNADSNDELRNLMDEWFELLSLDPANIDQADSIREKVNKEIMSSYMILF